MQHVSDICWCSTAVAILFNGDFVCASSLTGKK